MPFEFRGKHFEELPVGTEFYTPARTVTEADIVTFASFSGDWHPLHANREYAAQSAFGERIAHGLVTLAFVTGLMDKIGILEGTVVAFLGVEWNFKKAVKIGDTISAHLQVVDAKPTSKPVGVVKYAVRVTNQLGDEVSGGTLSMMTACKARGDAPDALASARKSS